MLKQAALKLLRDKAPHLWHFAKYQQYKHTSAGEPEIHVLQYLAQNDRIGLDIGVHLGFYSRHLVGLCSRVIGFEPNPTSAALAAACLPRNVQIENVALSDKAGTAILRIPRFGPDGGTEALGTLEAANPLGGAAFEEIEVRIARLDDYNLPPVGFMKIDVEGHEEAVLRGGTQLLQRDRPACMVEIEERHNSGAIARVLEYFEDLDYHAFYLSGGYFKSVDRGSIDTNELQGEHSKPYVNNFFFLPFAAPEALIQSKRLFARLATRATLCATPH